jgi:ATP-binding cassette subfamily F protein uup
MQNPILCLREISLAFGTKPIFSGLSLNIYPHDRVCLVGKNGEGKSSLLKTIAGIYELDGGEKWIMPGASIGYLPQEISYDTDQTIHDFVLSGMNDPLNIEGTQYLADIILEHLKLDPKSRLSALSGGLLRRAFLARALVTSPDILLLDEPTNHLDIDSITWLEEYVKKYRGAIVCISHDRTFLKNMSNKTFWLSSGIVKTNKAGYGSFDDWSLGILEQEQRALEKMGKKLSEEEQWKAKGIEARRKRSQKRLKDLYALRQKAQEGKAARSAFLNKIKLGPLTQVQSSKLVFEFKDVYKNYGSKKILESFSMRTIKGEKIGLVGPNGMGKTTFLQLLVGMEQPDKGTVKLGKTVEVTYYDQKRIKLNPEETLWENLCEETGGDHLKVGDRFIHVVAYLKNFMFDPKTARDKVSTLSGGQANRLLLAKALANPGSLLILDEPTNDLDMDTLDMIQDILADYKGTLLIVSHDRSFLDSLITKTLYFAGNGVVEEFFGSLTDFGVFKNKQQQTKEIVKLEQDEIKIVKSVKKLSYNLQRELELLPAKIAELEKEIADLEAKFAQKNFYQDFPEEFKENSKRVTLAKQELETAWTRWQELDGL